MYRPSYSLLDELCSVVDQGIVDQLYLYWISWFSCSYTSSVVVLLDELKLSWISCSYTGSVILLRISCNFTGSVVPLNKM